MRRLMLPMLIVLLSILTNWQRSDMRVNDVSREVAEQTAFSSQETHHWEATLTDASNLYRIGSPRPQRFIPTQSSKPDRYHTLSGFVRQKQVKPLHSFYDGRRRSETAPFCFAASCDYYVIALRHIIR